MSRAHDWPHLHRVLEDDVTFLSATSVCAKKPVGSQGVDYGHDMEVGPLGHADCAGAECGGHRSPCGGVSAHGVAQGAGVGGHVGGAHSGFGCGGRCGAADAADSADQPEVWPERGPDRGAVSRQASSGFQGHHDGGLHPGGERHHPVTGASGVEDSGRAVHGQADGAVCSAGGAGTVRRVGIQRYALCVLQAH